MLTRCFDRVHILPTSFRMFILGETRRRKPKMDWDSNFLRLPFGSHPSETSFATFLYNPNNDAFQGLEVSQMMVSPTLERNMTSYGDQETKKKRLTTDQLESLESSFQEEIKLDPERKMKLSRELGLQPRQVAVWFQNRRARWRAKKLEHLYDVLKQEYDVVTREKQKLQEEVTRLKSMLIEQATKKNQVSTGYTDVSCDETVESTTVAVQSSNKNAGSISSSEQNTQGHYLFNVDAYNPISPPYWGAFPSSCYP